MGGNDPTPPTKKTVTTVETNKDIYRRGDNVNIKETVTNLKSSPFKWNYRIG